MSARALSSFVPSGDVITITAHEWSLDRQELHHLFRGYLYPSFQPWNFIFLTIHSPATAKKGKTKKKGTCSRSHCAKVHLLDIFFCNFPSAVLFKSALQFIRSPVRLSRCQGKYGSTYILYVNLLLLIRTAKYEYKSSK